MDDELTLWLETLRRVLKAGDRPEFVRSEFGKHAIAYGRDDDGEFATVGFTLNDEWYAEIEDGTYGQLQGFRIYL